MKKEDLLSRQFRRLHDLRAGKDVQIIDTSAHRKYPDLIGLATWSWVPRGAVRERRALPRRVRERLAKAETDAIFTLLAIEQKRREETREEKQTDTHDEEDIIEITC
jgi:hypothetical protein